MKILVALDGSPHSDAAVSDLGRAGIPSDAEAVVLAVADAWVAPSLPAEMAGSGAGVGGSQAVVEAALARARDVSAAGAKRLRELHPQWRVTAEATAGSPAWEIVRRADEWTPDLAVVGATGTSALERVVFGSVASLVATNARCSVRIARERAGASGAPRVIVAVDGSPGGRDAVQAVARRAWPAGTQARVVEAIEDWALSLRGGRDGEPTRTTSDACEILAAAGLAATPHVVAGDAKHALVSEAEAWRADCVFMGAQGMHALERFLLGSVSTAVASRARCSVEIVRG